MKRTALLWMASSAAILALAACSNDDRGRAPGSEPSADRGAAVGTGGAGVNVNSDDEFVRDVAAKNLAEVELSRVALGRSASPEVKAFAQMMVDDHGAAHAGYPFDFLACRRLTRPDRPQDRNKALPTCLQAPGCTELLLRGRPTCAVLQLAAHSPPTPSEPSPAA